MNGRAVLEKANIDIIATLTWHPISASPTGLLDILMIYPNPAAIFIPFTNYSNNHHPLGNSTLLLVFPCVLSSFPCSLPFQQTTREKIFSYMNYLNFLLFFSPNPSISNDTCFSEWMRVFSHDAQLKAVLSYNLLLLLKQYTVAIGI